MSDNMAVRGAVGDVWYEVRQGVRPLVRRGLSTAAIVGTLAMCLGPNILLFGLVDRVLLYRLPYPDPDRLAVATISFRHQGVERVDIDGQSPATWFAIHEHATTIDAAAFSGGTGVNAVVGDRPIFLRRQQVSAGFFHVLGITPLEGREFRSEEDRPGSAAVAILSYGLWSHAFGSDPGVIGRSMSIRGEASTIVGLMPRTVQIGSGVDVWTPLRASRDNGSTSNNYGIIARLRRGVTWAQAQSEIDGITTDSLIEIQRVVRVDRISLALTPFKAAFTQDVRRPLLLLWAVMIAVLMIGCTNLASLLIARAWARRAEFATRLALGATVVTLVRQLTIEGVLFSFSGGLVGVGVASLIGRWARTWVRDLLGADVPVSPDVRVVGFVLAMCVVTTVLLTIAPIYMLKRVNLRSALADAGDRTAGTRSLLPRLLLVGQIAITTVLLAGAVTLVRTLTLLNSKNAGFDATDVVGITVPLLDVRYGTNRMTNRLFEQTLANIRRSPDIESAAVGLVLPFERVLKVGVRRTSGRVLTPQPLMVNLAYATPAYVTTLRIPLVRGREFTVSDSSTSLPVVLINETCARRLFPGEEPVGQQVSIVGATRQIVGVIADVQQKTEWGSYASIAPPPSVLMPAAQVPDALASSLHVWASPTWIVRTKYTESALKEMENAIAATDPLLPIANIRTLDESRREWLREPQMLTELLTGFAALALVLATVGIYGAIATSVTERTRELAIRAAIGAGPREVVWCAARPGLIIGVVGVSLGILMWQVLGGTLLFLAEELRLDFPTPLITVAVVVLTSTAASIVPAFRALSFEPALSLRAG
jgi:predicted permease